MKKIFSLVCVLVLTLSANAEFIRKANPRMAAQQDVAVTVDGVVAWRGSQDETGYYQFQFALENEGKKVGAISVLTKANNQVAGLYALPLSEATYLTIGGKNVLVYGLLEVDCMTPQSTTLGTYEFHASLTDGTTAYMLDGSCSDFIAVDYAQFQKDPSTAGVVLTDVQGCPGEVIPVYTEETEKFYDDYLETDGLFGYWAYDNEHTVDVVFAADVSGQQYYIAGGAHYVEGKVYKTDSYPNNGIKVVRGVLEVEYISDQDANISSFLQCEDGNVYYTYDVVPTGIEEVKAAEVNGTAKTMDQNGQLMIIRNGVRYNAQGAVIKR